MWNKALEFFDKFLCVFLSYRKWRKGHWERINLDTIASNASRSYTLWTRKEQCYGTLPDASSFLCTVGLECEENGKFVETTGNEDRFSGTKKGDVVFGRFPELTPVPLPPLHPSCCSKNNT
jgi:hypothetical protein